MANPVSLRLEQYPEVILNIAHRGARAFAPENTLAAFEKAKMFDCQMFEMDVRVSKDGELMVHHDDQLIRCTDVKAKFPDRSSYTISDFTYDELCALDAGSWYIEQLSLPGSQRQEFLQTLTDEELTQFVSPEDRAFYASGDVKVPTLKQTLEFAKDADLMVNIELKTQKQLDSGLAYAVVRLVEFMGFNHRVILSCFDHEQLVRVRQLTKNIATTVLTGDRLPNPGEYLQSLDADAYHLGCYRDYGALGFNSLEGKQYLSEISHLRQSGYSINVWTCNNKEEMRYLIAAGVTGLISDYPNRVKDVLAEQFLLG
ncbi:MAG: glycerophosphodiester phosphodiesterase family protein [Methylococcales bacterium]|nr:glycerophosphodiester phosphodiesterase family protein [Methylococcales bacterium]